MRLYFNLSYQNNCSTSNYIYLNISICTACDQRSAICVTSSEMHKTIATQTFEFKTHGSSLFSYIIFLNNKEKDRTFPWKPGGKTETRRTFLWQKIRSANT